MQMVPQNREQLYLYETKYSITYKELYHESFET